MPIRYTVPDLPHQPTGVHIRAVAGKPGYAVTDTGDVYGCRVGGHGVMYRSEWRLLKQKRRKPMPHLEVGAGSRQGCERTGRMKKRVFQAGGVICAQYATTLAGFPGPCSQPLI